jgi:hypothetical protein
VRRSASRILIIDIGSGNCLTGELEFVETPDSVDTSAPLESSATSKRSGRERRPQLLWWPILPDDLGELRPTTRRRSPGTARRFAARIAPTLEVT